MSKFSIKSIFNRSASNPDSELQNQGGSGRSVVRQVSNAVIGAFNSREGNARKLAFEVNRRPQNTERIEDLKNRKKLNLKSRALAEIGKSSHEGKLTVWQIGTGTNTIQPNAARAIVNEACTSSRNTSERTSANVEPPWSPRPQHRASAGWHKLFGAMPAGAENSSIHPRSQESRTTKMLSPELASQFRHDLATAHKIARDSVMERHEEEVLLSRLSGKYLPELEHGFSSDADSTDSESIYSQPSAHSSTTLVEAPNKPASYSFATGYPESRVDALQISRWLAAGMPDVGPPPVPERSPLRQAIPAKRDGLMAPTPIPSERR